MIKYIKGLKIFSIFALTCTVALWLVLWGMSLMPSASSGTMTELGTGVVDNVLGVQDKINKTLATQSIEIECDLDKKGYFYDDHPILTIKPYPEEARNKEVEYTVTTLSGNCDAEIDENGKVTFTETGNVEIKASLKDNPDIFDKIEFLCYGENPFDISHPERLSITTKNGNIDDFSSLTVGEKIRVVINNDKTSMGCVKITVEDESVVGYASGKFYPRKIGKTTVTAMVSNGNQNTTLTIPINVSNDGSIYTPEFVVKDNFTIHENEIIDYFSLIELPENADTNLYVCKVKSSNDKILKVISSKQLRSVGNGEVTLTYIPLFAPDKSFDVTVNVEKVTPQGIYIIGKDSVLPGSTYHYKAKTLPVNYNKDVEWKVVEGNATIDDDGNLTAKSYGTLVISCQSTIDGSVISEKTIKVTLYTSAYMFVRKLMGHAGLSALLGFGIVGTLLLLCKNKFRAVYAIPLSFIYAGVSELLQMFAPGRMCLFSDVLVDFIGTLVGIAVALILTAIVLLLWRLISKKSFDKLIFAIKLQSFKTLSKKSSRIEKYNCPHIPED